MKKTHYIEPAILLSEIAVEQGIAASITSTVIQEWTDENGNIITF